MIATDRSLPGGQVAAPKIAPAYNKPQVKPVQKLRPVNSGTAINNSALSPAVLQQALARRQAAPIVGQAAQDAEFAKQVARNPQNYAKGYDPKAAVVQTPIAQHVGGATMTGGVPAPTTQAEYDAQKATRDAMILAWYQRQAGAGATVAPTSITQPQIAPRVAQPFTQQSFG